MLKFRFNFLGRKKAANKMLVKLTTEVNLTNLTLSSFDIFSFQRDYLGRDIKVKNFKVIPKI